MYPACSIHWQPVATSNMSAGLSGVQSLAQARLPAESPAEHGLAREFAGGTCLSKC